MTTCTPNRYLRTADDEIAFWCNQCQLWGFTDPDPDVAEHMCCARCGERILCDYCGTALVNERCPNMPHS